MARIIVATSHPLFAHGGHLVIAEALVDALRAAGHDAATLLTPQNRFGRQGAAYTATWLTDVERAHDGRQVDQVISLRFPSYALRHSAHVCWLNHRMREYYDQWPVFRSGLSARAALKEQVRRRVIHAADRFLLTRNVTRVFAQSRTIQGRLMAWGHIPSTVVYPPPPRRAYRCDAYDDFILVVSRLTPLKRVGLVIDAVAERDMLGARVVVVGDGDDLRRLRAHAATQGVSDRVIFRGQVDETELLNQLARCRAVCFPSQHEDYGLVTLEAFSSSKAVVTCADSGGPAELVVDGVSGFVTPPNAKGLAAALGRVGGDAPLAERLGAAARRQADAVTWEHTLDQLLLV